MPRQEIKDRGESTGGIILPGRKKSYRQYLPQSGSCADKYEFAHSAGASHAQVIGHLGKVDKRIDELICLHEKHHALLVEAEAHLANENFRSAERVVKIYDKQRFPDIDYNKVDSLLERQLSKFGKFADLDAQVNAGNFREARENLRKVKDIKIKVGSELETAVSILEKTIQRTIDTHYKARKKSLMTKSIYIFLIVVAIGSLSAYVIQEEKKAQLVAAEANAKEEREAADARVKAEQEAAEARVKAEREAAEAKAKAEREAAEAKAKAEREAAEAKAKAETAYEKFIGNRAGEEKSFEIAPRVRMTFCWCPAGDFTMGSLESEEDRSSDENQAQVTLTKGFWMAKTELTQAQWTAIMSNNPSKFDGNDLPVENVSWEDTQEFIKKVNDSGVIPEGWKVDLPTEAQWEYACRAGETGAYSGGTIDQVAWYDDNSGSKTHSVGTKKSNAWGLHDMHGNVWEWCADWYDDSLSGGTDPSGPSSGVYRVSRGGSWSRLAACCRAAHRFGGLPDYRRNSLGFRPALVPSE
jgi:formylglycine-generating enzyme required for sulfatase activity